MNNELKAQANLVRAIAIAGGVLPLSRALGRTGHSITIQAIYAWKVVPLTRVREVSLITGIPLHSLRPDIWDAPTAATPPPPKQPALSPEA